jgi:hypothetical protein
MFKHIDIARALKDETYFNTLTAEQQAAVQAASGVGICDLSDDVLESVSGGLEGGIHLLYTSSSQACVSSSSAGAKTEAIPAIVCVC